MAVAAPVKSRVRLADAAIAVLVGAVSLAVYLSTMAPTFTWGDSSELTTAAYFLGIGHSPGYPTWMLLAYPFAHLPFASVAWRVNFMNALLGGVGVALLYLVFRRLSGSRPAAVIGALCFALTITFWDVNTDADVFTLYVCLAALSLLLILRWREEPRDRTLFLLAWLLGIAMGNHALILLLVPATVYLIWAERGARFLFSPRRVALVVACFALGFAVYVYLPIRALADPPPHQNSPRHGTFAELMEQTWVQMSAPQARPAMFHAPVKVVATRAYNYVTRVRVELGWGGVVLGALGLVWLWRRDRRLALFLLLVAVTDVAYSSNFSIFDIYSYYLPLYLMWAALIAVGAAAVLAGVARRWSRTAQPGDRVQASGVMPACAAALLFCVPALLYADHLAVVDRHEDREAERYARFVMARLEPKSAFLADWWVIAPMGYLKYVEGVRPDVQLFPAPSTPKDEQVRRFARAEFVDAFPVVYFTEMITKRTPIFREQCYLVPEGPMWRVLAHRPAPGQVLVKLAAEPVASFGNRVGLVRADLPTGALTASHVFPFVLYWTPRPGYTRRPLEVMVKLQDADGEAVWQEYVPIGHDLYPREQWQAGQVLREQHAIFLNEPPAPGEYTLSVRVWERGEGGKLMLLDCDRPAADTARGTYRLRTMQAAAR